MARYSAQFLSVSALIFTLLLSQCCARSLKENPRKDYIVLELCGQATSPLDLLKQVLVGAKPEKVLLYLYSDIACGFAAKLTETETKKLEKINGVLGVIPSLTYHLEPIGFPIPVQPANAPAN